MRLISHPMECMKMLGGIIHRFISIRSRRGVLLELDFIALGLSMVLGYGNVFYGLVGIHVSNTNSCGIGLLIVRF